MTRKLFLSLLCVSFLFFSSHAMAQTQQQFKQIPTKQWEQLTSSINLYEANLILVQDMLIEQEMLSKELMQSLINANVELNTARQELKNATSSLQKAEEALKKLSESYGKLKSQIEVERTEALKRERDAYRKGWLNGFCFGLVGTTLLLT